MKILIISLARYGDTLLTQPIVAALKNKYSNAHIHLLVRERYKDISCAFEQVQLVIPLSSKTVLKSFFTESKDKNFDPIKPAIDELLGYVNYLSLQKYDQIINLTFSPLSSYLAHAISTKQTQVKGYTRYDDGSFRLMGEESAYFYAQVGTGKSNDIHLVDLFASIADVELEKYQPSVIKNSKIPMMGELMGMDFQLSEKLVIHIGASNQNKTLSVSGWVHILNNLKPIFSGEIVLVGSADEILKAQKIAQLTDVKDIVNKVGKTTMNNLVQEIKSSQYFIGGDSLCMHIASLNNIPTLNISFTTVNFKETGPIADRSFIWKLTDESFLEPTKTTNVLELLLNDAPLEPKLPGVYINTGQTFLRYKALFNDPEQNSYSLLLVKALYLGDDYPVSCDKSIATSLQALYDVVELYVTELSNVSLDDKASHQKFQIIELINQCHNLIADQQRELLPLVRWFEAENVKIGPMPMADLLHRSLELNKNYLSIIKWMLYQELLIQSDTGVEQANL